MPLVTVDSNVLDQTTMLALVGVAAIVLLIILLIYLFYNRYRTPKEALDIKTCSNKGKMAIVVAGLDAYTDIMPVDDFIPEGVKETRPIGKGAKKMSLRFAVPKAETAPEDLEVAEGKSKEITQKVIQALYDLNTEKVFLRKAKIPMLFATKNSVAAVSLKFLGVLTFLKKLERIQQNGVLYKQIEALKQSKNFTELGTWLSDLANTVTVVDFRQVYIHAASVVGQTKLDSISERDQTIGRREGKEDKEKQTKTLLLYFGFAMCGLAALIAVIYFFGGR